MRVRISLSLYLCLSVRTQVKTGEGKVVDLNDPVQRKDFLITQMRLAEEKMRQSKRSTGVSSVSFWHTALDVFVALVLSSALHLDKLSEAISHLINFVSLSGNPHEALAALQQSLPPTIFQILVQTMARLGEEVRSLHSSTCLGPALACWAVLYLSAVPSVGWVGGCGRGLPGLATLSLSAVIASHP